MSIQKQPYVPITSPFTQEEEFCQKHAYKLKVTSVFTQDIFSLIHFSVATL